MAADAHVQLSPEDRARLEGWVAGRNTPQKLVWRARIVLMWAQGVGLTAIVRATGKTKRTVYRWRDRYVAQGVAGLERDATRPGRKPPLSAAAMIEIFTNGGFQFRDAHPTPFVWTKSPADILEKVARGRRVLESQH